jgi:hypothetical protein
MRGKNTLLKWVRAATVARCLALFLILGQLALLAHRLEHVVDVAPDGHAAACVFCIPVLDPPAPPVVGPPVQLVVVAVAPAPRDVPAPLARAQLGFRAQAPPPAGRNFPHDLKDLA